MRRLPGKLLPHRELVKVHTYLGGGADGRKYKNPETIKRALIVDKEELVRDQYDAEVISSTTVFFERSEVAEIPVPETKITIWAGTPDEHETVVIKSSRLHHPRIADLLEVKLI